MKCLLVFAGIVFLSSLAVAQTVDPARSGNQARMNSLHQRLQGKTSTIQDGDNDKFPPKTINLDEIQNKTDEMNGMVQSLNEDMKTLQKGMLPADLTQRLKRIEKL